MQDELVRTRSLLERHHRDGARFVELMKETSARRFDEAFWESWQRWIDPVLPPNPQVLDLGTGPGMFLQALHARYPQARGVGVECAPYMLDAARAALPPGYELLTADLHDPHLPLDYASIDAALAAMVLHEMQQPIRALRETHRCLRPGGRLYIIDWVRAPLAQYLEGEGLDVFNPVQSPAQLEDAFVHFIEHNRYTREDLAFLLEHLGYKVLSSEPLGGGQFARVIAERSVIKGS